jgi:uncharacterized protein (DUF885 family)
VDRRHFLASGTAATALSLLPRAALAATATAGDAALDALFVKIFDEGLLESPESATGFGLDKGALAPLKSRLDDRSAAGRSADLARTRASIARIEAIKPDTLSAAGKLNREVVLYSLNSQTVGPAKFGVGSAVRPYTITQQQGAYFDVPDFLNSQHTIKTAADAEAYLSRLSAFATALDQDSEMQRSEAARGILAPDFSLDLALGQMTALRSQAPAQSSLVTSVATRAAVAGLKGDWSKRAADIVTAKVYPALDRQIALIRQLRTTASDKAGLWRLPKGDEIYAAALAGATTTDFTPDEVHKIGLEQVAQLTAQLDTILKSQGLTQGTVGERLTVLNKQPAQLYADSAAGRAELIAGLNAGVAAMQAKLPQAFINPPRTAITISPLSMAHARQSTGST